MMIKDSVYIIGGGTLGKYIIDILEASSVKVGGIFDDIIKEDNVLGYPVLGKISDITSINTDLAIGIGDPDFREKVMEKFEFSGHNFPSIIHPGATISKHAVIKDGTIIGPGCNIMAETEVGKGACLLSSVQGNQKVKIGDYSLVGAGVNIGNGAILGKSCHISMSITIPPNSVINDGAYVK